MSGTALLDIHVVWAWVVVCSNAAVGLWCLGAHWLAPLRVRQLWWAVIAAEVAIAMQVLLGVVLVAGEGIDAPEFHMFYGFIALVSVAILYSYRTQIKAWLYLLYGFGSLFLMGLAIRAMVLG
ncbi:MAG: hypothetical protein ACK5O2_16055 [Microthrixaceae bacterium]